MKSMLTMLLGAALLQAPAWGAAPAPLRVVESVEIKAPTAKVWDAVKDFDGLNKWHPGFSADVIVSGGNGQLGSVRKLTIKDGPSFTEKLLSYDEAGHTYRYQIIESPLPITDYVSRITVRSAGGGMTKVIWSSTFKRKNPAANPPEAESDAGATKLVQGVYRGGLDNLKKMLEGTAP
jgi:mxaD protein